MSASNSGPGRSARFFDVEDHYGDRFAVEVFGDGSGIVNVTLKGTKNDSMSTSVAVDRHQLVQLRDFLAAVLR